MGNTLSVNNSKIALSEIKIITTTQLFAVPWVVKKSESKSIPHALISVCLELHQVITKGAVWKVGHLKEC